MKHFKTNILQKFILLLLVTTFITNCSSEETTTDDAISKDFKKEAKLVFDSYNLIEKDFSDTLSRTSSTELSQQQIDQYLELIGLNVGSVTVQNVNQIINEVSLVTEEDVEFFINQTTYTQLTKSMLIEVSKGEVIYNLNTIPGFEQLNISEKEILIFSNEIAKEYMKNNSSSALNRSNLNQNCPSSGCGVAFAIAGAIAGNAICGVVCGIAGGIIGLIIGTAGK